MLPMVILLTSLKFAVPTFTHSTANWDIFFDSRLTNKQGEVVLSGNNILEFTDIVKGNWSAKAFNSGEYVFHDGVWHLADDAANAPTADDIPYNPNFVDKFSTSTGYSEGNPVVSDDPATSDGNVLIATDIMKGTFFSYELRSIRCGL